MPEGSSGDKDTNIGIKSSELQAADRQLNLSRRQPPNRTTVNSVQNYNQWILTQNRRLFSEPRISNFDLPHLDFRLRKNTEEDRAYVYQYTGQILDQAQQTKPEFQSIQLPAESQIQLKKALEQIKTIVPKYLAGDMHPEKKDGVLQIIKSQQDLFEQGMNDPEVSKDIIKMLTSLRLDYPIRFNKPPEYSAFFINFIQNNLPAFQKALESDDPELSYDVMTTVNSVLYGGQFKWASDFLLRNFEKTYINSTHRRDFGQILFMLGSQDETTVSSVQILARHLMSGGEPIDDLIRGLAGTIKNYAHSYGEGKYYHLHQLNLLYRMYEPKLKSYGLNPQAIYSSWRKTDRMGLNSLSNITAIEELDNENSGICRRLHERFGISNFGRYPVNKLLFQDQETNNKPMSPYGVILYPDSDNPSPAYYQDYQLISDLFDSAADAGILPVIFEFNTKADLLKRLSNFNQHQTNKADFALVGGHGSEVGELFFGATSGFQHLRQHKLSTQDTTDPRFIKYLSSFLKDRATLILHSCFAGKEAGIGQNISGLGYEVIGPDKETHLSSVNLSRINGHLEFKVDYGMNAKTLHYEDAKKLPPHKRWFRTINRKIREKLAA